MGAILVFSMTMRSLEPIRKSAFETDAKRVIGHILTIARQINVMLRHSYGSTKDCYTSCGTLHDSCGKTTVIVQEVTLWPEEVLSVKKAHIRQEGSTEDDYSYLYPETNNPQFQVQSPLRARLVVVAR